MDSDTGTRVVFWEFFFLGGGVIFLLPAVCSVDTTSSPSHVIGREALTLSSFGARDLELLKM